MSDLTRQTDNEPRDDELVVRVSRHVLADLTSRVEDELAKARNSYVAVHQNRSAGVIDALEWVLEQIDDMDENLTEGDADG
jgi:hypothetical protein